MKVVTKSPVKKSKTPTKISEEELKELQSHIGALNNIINQVGEIEVRKAYAIMAHQEGEGKLSVFRSKLKEKYGNVNINPRTGDIEPSDVKH